MWALCQHSVENLQWSLLVKWWTLPKHSVPHQSQLIHNVGNANFAEKVSSPGSCTHTHIHKILLHCGPDSFPPTACIRINVKLWEFEKSISNAQSELCCNGQPTKWMVRSMNNSHLLSSCLQATKAPHSPEIWRAFSEKFMNSPQQKCDLNARHLESPGLC